MMFASYLIMAGAGATYLFGVYSKTIKSTLGYDQTTLNLLSTFKDLGANVGVLSGLLAEVTPTWEEYTSWKLKKKELESVPSRVIVEEPPFPVSKAPVSEIELPEYSSIMVKIQEKEEVGCFSDIFKKPKRGCSLTSIDNLGQIGFISEKLLLKWKVPRTLMMTLALILPAIGDLIIAFPFSGSVYVASLLIGFSFGVQLTLLFIIISELFGLKYYSTLFNCGQLASPLGSYILNVQVVGRLYDDEALKQLESKGLTRLMVKELTCIGKQCYRNSFIILACVNLFGALVSLILVKRTMEYYKSDIYKRFRDQMEANEKEMKMISTAEK
ncbi:hypothetical protein KY285_007034 [Solanum tuberosum]|nr:hypothetical protein KY285_007034 [Solanum tuberosum]